MQGVLPCLWSPKKGAKKASLGRYPYQFLHREGAFSDRKPFNSKRAFKKGRFHVHNRPQGCIFSHPNSPKVSELPLFHLGRSSISFSLSSVRADISTKDFHQINENNSNQIKAGRFEDDRF